MMVLKKVAKIDSNVQLKAEEGASLAVVVIEEEGEREGTEALLSEIGALDSREKRNDDDEQGSESENSAAFKRKTVKWAAREIQTTLSANG